MCSIASLLTVNLIEISRPEQNEIKLVHTTSDYDCMYCGRFIREVFKFNLLL